MKEIKRFKEGDHIPENAKYLSSIQSGDDFTFFYEVTIRTEQTSVSYDTLINDVIEYLNFKTGKNFKPTGKNAQLIRDRVKTDKATLDDFTACIDNMVTEWSDNPKMKGYLRPATLFQASKFDGYVNHKSGAQEAADAFADLENYIK